jgi:hypothetical protein
MRTIEDVLNRLRSEFLETPGLRLKSERCNGCVPSIERSANCYSIRWWMRSFSV